MAVLSKIVIPALLILAASALGDAATADLPITNLSASAAPSSKLSSSPSSLAVPFLVKTTATANSTLARPTPPHRYPTASIPVNKTSTAPISSHSTSSYYDEVSSSTEIGGCIFVAGDDGTLVEIPVPVAELEQLGAERTFVPATEHSTKQRASHTPTPLAISTLRASNTLAESLDEILGRYGVEPVSANTSAPAKTGAVGSRGTPIAPGVGPVGPVSINLSPVPMTTVKPSTLVTSTKAKATFTGGRHMKERRKELTYQERIEATEAWIREFIKGDTGHILDYGEDGVLPYWYSGGPS